MHPKLEKLRQVLGPVTDEQARASMERYEATQVDAPGFAYAAEIEMWPEYLTEAQVALRQAPTSSGSMPGSN